MKIANIGFLLTIEVLQAVSHPSDWWKSRLDPQLV